MTKTPDRRSPGGGKGRRQSPRREILVRASSGQRHPFLRGMVTHDLVQRGLSFDDAYAAARAIRDRIADRDEISTTELKGLIEQQLEEMLGPERFAALPSAPLSVPGLEVYQSDRSLQPFSRGLLARSIHAAGVDLDRAYRVITHLERELRQDGLTRLDREELARRVADLLDQFEGEEAATRYRVMRSIRRLPRPLVIYLGGASGTGKSTLALDLAPLLRIYRINATDTIRQVMRMVFSPAILPAIHRSSFERYSAFENPFPREQGQETGESESRQLAIASFQEQAIRICVGVRAVVERSIAENLSVVVEGVHLVPPLVPFPDLDGAAYQLALILTTLEYDVHRARFLERGQLSGRHTERYLDSFASIRLIQEFILAQAEQQEVPLLETTERETTLFRALRLLTGMLQQRYPKLVHPAAAARRAWVPTLLLTVDGLPDRPLRALGGRTPLEAAKTPTLDRLAREGRCGLADPVAPGVVPDTASGSLALFGQSPLAMKRGPVEALGAGLNLSPGDIALRANFATLDQRGWVSDRRAGRIRSGASSLAQALDRLPLPGSLHHEVTVRVGVSTEHRLAVVLRGEGLSSAIVGSDPGDGAPPGPPLTPQPIDLADPAAVQTAKLLALFEQEARRVLRDHAVNLERVEQHLPPANAILTRGAGRIHRLPPLEVAGASLRMTCISGDRTLLGLAAWLGAETFTSGSMTANLDTDLRGKFAAALEQLERSDLVVLHVKGADIAAHDRRSDRKVAFIEEIDRQLAWLLEARQTSVRIVVASDHATLSEVGQHAADPVPVLIWGPGIEPDRVDRFSEQSVGGGGLQRFPLQLLIERLSDLG